MNYYSNIKLRSYILNKLLKNFDINIKPNSFYLTKKEIKYISEIGMLIGSHTINHNLLSRLVMKSKKRNSKQ